MAIVYDVWGKVAIVYGVWGKVAIFYVVFQKRLFQNQGPEKKGVSDDFFFIFLNPDLHSLAKKMTARDVCFSVQPLQGLSGTKWLLFTVFGDKWLLFTAFEGKWLLFWVFYKNGEN